MSSRNVIIKNRKNKSEFFETKKSVSKSSPDLGLEFHSENKAQLESDLDLQKGGVFDASKARSAESKSAIKSKRAPTRYSLNKNKYLLPPEVDALKNALEKFYSSDPRNCLLIGLALRTGGRAQELLNLQKVDINTYDQTVYIRGIKGSSDREIPLHEDFFKQLAKYSESINGTSLFDFSYMRLYQIWDLYRPVAKKFHSLRHTFAIQLYQKTKDLRLVQVALGHRNITNTMIYADYVYSQQELRKLILD